jgi:hypothetical protein
VVAVAAKAVAVAAATAAVTDSRTRPVHGQALES